MTVCLGSLIGCLPGLPEVDCFKLIISGRIISIEGEITAGKGNLDIISFVSSQGKGEG
jgi:hypothetical protein